MPLQPPPADVSRERVVESCGNAQVCQSFRPPPGSVPFDVHLEGANRIARATDTFSLSPEASAKQAYQTRADRVNTMTSSSKGWAKIGEILTGKKPSAQPQSHTPKTMQPQPQTTVQRHTGTGRMIDVIM